MAQNVYEGMLILDSNRYGRDPGGTSGDVTSQIEEKGGEILVSRLWDERRLAYPIEGHRKGTYWLTYFRLDGVKLADVERHCQLSENVLRALFLKVDPRIVDTLVAHAQSATTAGSRLKSDAAGKPADDNSDDDSGDDSDDDDSED